MLDVRGEVLDEINKSQYSNKANYLLNNLFIHSIPKNNTIYTQIYTRICLHIVTLYKEFLPDTQKRMLQRFTQRSPSVPIFWGKH